MWREDIRVFHEDPPNFREVLLQKRRHGTGRVYLWQEPRSLQRLINWYFAELILAGLPPSYVIPAHIASIEGIS
jgi:hypothetical protein